LTYPNVYRYLRRDRNGSVIISYRSPVYRFKCPDGFDDVGVVCVLRQSNGGEFGVVVVVTVFDRH